MESWDVERLGYSIHGASQSVVPGPAAAASLGNLRRLLLVPTPHPLTEEFWKVAQLPELLASPPDDLEAPQA